MPILAMKSKVRADKIKILNLLNTMTTSQKLEIKDPFKSQKLSLSVSR